jgi:DNA repair exonuclease SbcCD nuclease subunit
MIKFIHTSDWHLGANFSVLPPDLAEARRQEHRKVLEELADFAIEKKVDLFLVAGDLFNSSNPGSADIAFVKNLFAKLSGSNIKIFIIPGNHDAYEVGGFWDKNDFDANIFKGSNISSFEIPELDLSVFGYPTRRSNRHERIISEISKTNLEKRSKNSILLFHGSWENFGREGEKDYPFSTDEILKVGFDYIALGNYHQFAEVTQNAAFSGNPVGLDFSKGELGKKSFIYGKLENGKTQLLAIETSAKKFLTQNIDLTTLSPAQLLTEINSQKDNNKLIRFELSGIASMEMLAYLPSLEQDISGLFGYVEIRENFTSHVTADSNTYLGMYCKKLQEKIDAEKDEEKIKIYQKALEIGVALFNKI